MKKLYSLIRACMTSDMKLFKIKTGKKGKFIPLFIAFYLMFMIWGSANSMFEKLAPIGMHYLLLSIFVFAVSIMTLMEGIYKAGSLMFNCKDDWLLLSLPIKKRTVLFVRIFKFYVFELLFNSMFILPVMVAYIRWAPSLDWTYYLTSFVMLIMLPIIPIILSAIISVITSSIASRFKYKNAMQIILSMILILGIILLSYNMDGIFNYIVKHATSINDLIIKIYYPAGIYAKLITEFKILDLIIFILVNVIIFCVSILILSKYYFKINSRLKKVETTKKVKIDKLVIQSKPKMISLIKKEINTFFKTPVFIVNAGFALILYIIATIVIVIKYDSFMSALVGLEGMNFTLDLIKNNMAIVIFVLLSVASFMTSITNSLISLEGRNINIVKSLPINTKSILMSKIYSSLLITTPALLVGDIILFVKFRIKIVEILLLIILSILIPLVSHFIGLSVNLKYPKLDAESSTEVVKQSASSFISVIIGMILLIITITIITNIVGKISPLLILVISTGIYTLLDLILYMYLIKVGVKEFNKLSI